MNCNYNEMFSTFSLNSGEVTAVADLPMHLNYILFSILFQFIMWNAWEIDVEKYANGRYHLSGSFSGDFSSKKLRKLDAACLNPPLVRWCLAHLIAP